MMYLKKISKTPYTYSTSDGAEKSQTMVFRDGAQQWEATLPQGYDATRDVAMNDDATLSSFFERPIFSTNYSWAPGDPVFYQFFDPWSVFFSGARVINRISNFNLMTANLCVKFLINGNSFYYGRLMADYQLIPGIDLLTDTTSGLGQIVPASQRLHLYLNPTTSEGGVLRLPFVYNKDTVNVPSAGWTGLGKVFIREMNALKHANGSTVGLTISVSIWAENVKLSVPTTVNPIGIVNQSGDEYGDTKISDIATSVASTMNSIRDVPIIGSYAKATSSMANMLGAMAKIFGYSRPAIISDAMQMRAMPIGPLANTDRGDSVTRLTYDTKQELSIDPKIIGVETGDEMSINSLVTRESYFTRFNWATTDVANQLLMNFRVDPNVCNVSGTKFFLPACAFAALPFRWWRGTVKYRFQIVASEYHRGRLIFNYDPNYKASSEANIQFSRIIDLENERDFTIEVSWASHRHYLRCSGLGSAANYYSTTAFSSTSTSANGVLSVSVLNQLTTPNSIANNDIQINCFISMCDDAEFAVLDSARISLVTYSPTAASAFTGTIVNQSGESPDAPSSDAPEAEYSTETIQHCLPVDHTNDVYFGERIVSFRSLLKRYMYLTTYKNPSVAYGVWTLVQKDFPMYRGEFSSALSTNAAVIKYNFATTTLLNYLAPAYFAYRGSLRSKYMIYNDQPNSKSYAFISRNNAEASTSSVANTINNANGSSVAGDSLQYYPDGASGSLATATDIMPVLEVEFPYYSDLRFESTKVPNLEGHGGGAGCHSLVVQSTNTASSISGAHRWIATGEDFNLYLFQGAPPLYSRVNAA